MAYRTKDEIATDAAISADFTDHLKGRTVAKITVEEASEYRSGEIYGSINIHFTDDTVLVINEGGQAGYMDYLICLPFKVIEGDCPNG